MMQKELFIIYIYILTISHLSFFIKVFNFLPFFALILLFCSFQESKFYKNYCRMNEDLFEELLVRITSHAQRKDTVMHQAINSR